MCPFTKEGARMGRFDRSDYVETLDAIGAQHERKGARHEAVYPLPNLPPRAAGKGTGEIGSLKGSRAHAVRPYVR